MADAVLGILLTANDQATPVLRNMTQTLQQNKAAMRELAQGALFMGAAFVTMGLALKQVNSPMAQTLGNTLAIVGGILAFIGTVGQFVSAILKITSALQKLNVAQVISKALSGPIGWAQLGIGLGVAAAAVGTIGLISSRQPAPVGSTVNINSPAFTGSAADARKFGAQVQQVERQQSRLGR